MSAQFDFKKEWEKTKKQLVEFSKEATKVAKKGEEELIKFSNKSILHIDATAASMKKEKLYYQIGKEYVKFLHSNSSTSRLEKLLKDLNAVELEEEALKKRIKTSAKAKAKKKAVKKKAAKKKKAVKKKTAKRTKK